MKKALSALLALHMLLLAACGGSAIGSASPSPDTSTTSAVSVPAPSLPQQESSETTESVPERIPSPSPREREGVVAELSDILDEQQQDAYNKAQQAMLGFSMSAGFFGSLFSWGDGGQEDMEQGELEQDGRSLQKLGGRWLLWEDFYAEMLTIFTPELFLELNGTHGYETYLNIDGYTYFSFGDRGGDISHLYDSYELISATEDRVEFYLIGTYIDLDANDEKTLSWDVFPGEDFVGVTYDILYPIVLVKQDGHWLAAEFDLSF